MDIFASAMELGCYVLYNDDDYACGCLIFLYNFVCEEVPLVTLMFIFNV